MAFESGGNKLAKIFNKKTQPSIEVKFSVWKVKERNSSASGKQNANQTIKYKFLKEVKTIDHVPHLL